MSDKVWNALFICTGNSARSIFGEVLLNEMGEGRFRAFSAGTRPRPELNPVALEVLRRNGHDVTGLRAKHLSAFQQPGAPRMDFVFTVCDTAAAEACPPWPGLPITGHWPIPDPVRFEGSDEEKLRVFGQTIHWLRRRIQVFLDTPIATLDRIALQGAVDRIGALPIAD